MLRFIAKRLFSSQRDVINCDVAIVGAGPAGLSTAIRLKQLKPDFEVIVLEKGAEVGAHIVSGNCFNPKALSELLPNWNELNTPVQQKVTHESMQFLTSNRAISVPHMLLPNYLKHDGCYIISLGSLCRWLGEYADGLGVDIYPGFSATEIIYNEDGSMKGVATGDQGVGKDGKKKDNYMPGIEIHAKQTVLSEGCRGSLSELLIQNYDLRNFQDDTRRVQPQTYGIGLKELWKVKDSNFQPGKMIHTFGYPLSFQDYGGGFLYHMQDNIVHVGLVMALDYKNPYISPYQEFQKLKLHPAYRSILEGGECIGYGARAVNEGGFFSIPRLTFPGGMLTGCSAGFLNPAKIQGAHNAMKSGILAAEAIAEADQLEGTEIRSFYDKYRNSWLWDQLYKGRNFRSGFNKGLIKGSLNAFYTLQMSDGKPLFKNLKVEKHSDADTTELAQNHQKIEYAKPDGSLTFDLLTSVFRSSTNHEHDQPVHLKIKKGMEEKPSKLSHKLYDGPEQRFCPAGVYEFQDDKLKINAQNCVHCKTCDIKTPGNYIQWTCPEGGGGPIQQVLNSNGM